MDGADCSDEAELCNPVERLLYGREAITSVGYGFIASPMKVDPASPTHSNAARKLNMHIASNVVSGAPPTSGCDVPEHVEVLGVPVHSSKAAGGVQQHSAREVGGSIPAESYHATTSKQQQQLRDVKQEKPCKPEVEQLNIKPDFGVSLYDVLECLGCKKPSDKFYRWGKTDRAFKDKFDNEEHK